MAECVLFPLPFGIIDSLANYGNECFRKGVIALADELEKVAVRPNPNSMTQFEPFINISDLHKLIGKE